MNKDQIREQIIALVRQYGDIATQKPAFEPGTPKELYVVPVPGSYNGVQGMRYCWAPIGDRALAIASSESNAPVMVVENWRARLARK